MVGAHSRVAALRRQRERGVTRDPVKMSATGSQLTLWAAPDNGEEGNGTELFTYQATVIP